MSWGKKLININQHVRNDRIRTGTSPPLHKRTFRCECQLEREILITPYESRPIRMRPAKLTHHHRTVTTDCCDRFKYANFLCKSTAVRRVKNDYCDADWTSTDVEINQLEFHPRAKRSAPIRSESVLVPETGCPSFSSGLAENWTQDFNPYSWGHLEHHQNGSKLKNKH